MQTLILISFTPIPAELLLIYPRTTVRIILVFQPELTNLQQECAFLLYGYIGSHPEFPARKGFLTTLIYRNIEALFI